MIIKHFERWLKKNLHQFKYKPYKVGYGKYRFEGVVDNVVLKVTNKTPEVELYIFDNEGDELLDIITINYILMARHIKNKGYTDLDCVDKDKCKFYPTYQEMIEKELFEKLVNYCKKDFITTNYLHIYPSGATIDNNNIVKFDTENSITIKIIKEKVSNDN